MRKLENSCKLCYWYCLCSERSRGVACTEYKKAPSVDALKGMKKHITFNLTDKKENVKNVR